MVVDLAAARQARQDAILKARIDELWELLKRWVHEGEDEDIARTLSSGAWLLENLLQEFYPHHRRRRDVPTAQQWREWFGSPSTQGAELSPAD